MPLSDPVAVYNASSNDEAHLVRDALQAAGVEAYVTEDLSVVGGWVGGLIPEIHKPQVWVDRASVDRAGPVLEDYERRAAERANPQPAGPPIEVVCEECGATNTYPTVQQGTVQQCAACAAYLDVGEEAPFDDWQAPGEEEGDGREEP
jgi:Putative prokaryotic signal transducing protein